MFSLARSRYTLVAQFVFLATNALALVLGISYNAQTPDLYPNNAHHKIGWIATWVVSAQVLVSVAGRVAGIARRDEPQNHNHGERQAFIPVSTENMAEHQRINNAIQLHKYRESYDSGQGTEPNTESLRSNSVETSSGQQSPISLEDHRIHYDEDEDLEFKPTELGATKPWPKYLSLASLAGKISNRTWKILLIGYNVIDRTILILGYIALATGIIAWARFFVRRLLFLRMAFAAWG